VKAIILAAGAGNRLKPVTDKMPKCLIKIGGKTILERMLDSLIASGVNDISFVVGHKKRMITDLVGNKYKGKAFSFIDNPDYELGSIVSLWAARERFFGDDALLMDADVIFERGMLARLIGSKNANCFLFDRDLKDTGEEMKVAALNKKVVQIARKLTREHDEAGEGVGFCKIAPAYYGELLKALKNRICLNGNCDYELALDDFIGHAPAGFEEITGLRWTEVDFPEDIRKAESLKIN
jgi:choline kinase